MVRWCLSASRSARRNQRREASKPGAPEQRRAGERKEPRYSFGGGEAFVKPHSVRVISPRSSDYVPRRGWSSNCLVGVYPNSPGVIKSSGPSGGPIARNSVRRPGSPSASRCTCSRGRRNASDADRGAWFGPRRPGAARRYSADRLPGRERSIAPAGCPRSGCPLPAVRPGPAQRLAHEGIAL